MDSEKRPRNSKAIRVNLSPQLTPFLDFHLNHVRPSLNVATIKKKGFWLSKSGNCLQSRNITKIVKNISKRFCGKNLTPISFRRIVPSLVFTHLKTNNDKNLETMIKDYAEYLNTSVEMLLTHYIYNDTSNYHQQTRKKIENILQIDNPTTKRIVLQTSK